MTRDERDNSKTPPAQTGNASNPSPNNADMEPQEGNQLLGEKAEKYLREVASPEDYPDEEDWEEANKTLKEDKE
jgi:hypothetical protein